MRYIGKHKNMNLRQRQVEILCDVMSKLKGADEIEWFLELLLTPSELAYVSQRIDIIQQILKEQSYSEIRYEVGTTNGTINVTKHHLKNADEKFWKLVLSGKPKPIKPEKKFIKEKNWIEPHYPGAIRF